MQKAGRQQTENSSALEERDAEIKDAVEQDADEQDVPSINISDAQIAKRAYYIYLERGGEDGNAFDDWIQAERELRAGLEA